MKKVFYTLLLVVGLLVSAMVLGFHFNDNSSHDGYNKGDVTLAIRDAGQPPLPPVIQQN